MWRRSATAAAAAAIIADGGSLPSRRLLLAGGAAALLAGPAAAPPARAASSGPVPSEFAWGDALRRIHAAGQIVFALPVLPAPPLNVPDPKTHRPSGYDVEIATLIARDLGVAPVFKEAGVAARLEGLMEGQFDVALGGTANTPARALQVAFSRSYIAYHQVIMLPAGATATHPADLDTPPTHIAVGAGTSAEQTAPLLFPRATIAPMPLNEAVRQLMAGAVAALLVELYVAGPFARSQKAVTLMGGVETPTIVATEHGCLACRASEMALRQWLDNWLDWYDSHGVLARMYERTVGAPIGL